MSTTCYTSKGRKIRLGERLGTPGAEGSVYALSSYSHQDCCVKLFHSHLRNEKRIQKITYMIKFPPKNLKTSTYQICWPLELIYEHKNKNNFLGFLMPRAFPNSTQLYELCQVQINANRIGGDWSNKFDRGKGEGLANRLKLCVNIAIAIHNIHTLKNYTLVDMKPQNMLVTNTGKVSLIDLDSIQIANPTHIVHPGQMATPEYIPPEGNLLNPAQDYIPESWDRFSLAVILYEIIFGIHPFTATAQGPYAHHTTIESKIRNGLFVHGAKAELHIQQPLPKPHFNFKKVPHPLKMLFLSAFEGGHQKPDLRPTAEQWGTTLHQEVARFIQKQQGAYNSPFASNLYSQPIRGGEQASTSRFSKFFRHIFKGK